MSEQPNALRLATLLDEGNASVYRKHATEAAAELRRLVAQRDELLEAIKSLVECINDTRGPSADKALERARAAIAKGEQG